MLKKNLRFLKKSFYLKSLLFILIVVISAVSCNVSPGPLPSQILKFVDERGLPIEGQFTILCSDSPAVKISITTDSNGNSVGWNSTCSQIAALHHRKDLATSDKFNIFSISWEARRPTFVSTSEDIVINSKNLFLLFNPVVSIAWELQEGSSVLDEAALLDSFLAASENLYDLTEGQMAFGEVTIHTGGENWRNADFRFLAANDLRPSASLGGIMEEPTPYDVDIPTSPLFTPGAIFLGRTWDPNDWRHTERQWDDIENARTLVHEWAHYALFLYDEYIGLDGGGDPIPATCECDHRDPTCSSEVSAMYWQEDRTEFWYQELSVASEALTACQQTLQWQRYERSDWEIISEWFGIMGIQDDGSDITFVLPDSSPLDGGNFQIAKPFFNLACPTCITNESEPELTIGHFNDSSQSATPLAHIYTMVSQGENPPFEAVSHILYQGSEFLRPTIHATGSPDYYQGGLRLLGTNNQMDKVSVFVDTYGENDSLSGQFYGSQILNSESEPFNEVSEGKWMPELDIIYQAETDISMQTNLVSMTAILTETTGVISDGIPIYGQLCVPGAADGLDDPDGDCSPVYEMAEDSNIAFSLNLMPALADLGYSKVPLYSILRLYSPNVGEIIRYVQSGTGAGPGGGCPHLQAPTTDGTYSTYIRRVDQDCGSVVVWMPAANPNILLIPPNSKGVRRFVSVPIDVDVVYANNHMCSLDNAEASFLTQSYDDQTVCTTSVLDALPRSQDIDRFMIEIGISEDKFLDYRENLLDILSQETSLGEKATEICTNSNSVPVEDIIAAAESRLVTLHYNPDGSTLGWEVVNRDEIEAEIVHQDGNPLASSPEAVVEGLDSDHNLLTTPINDDGIYVLGLISTNP